MKVQGRRKRGRPKRRWLNRVKMISEKRDCRGRKCTTELHGGVCKRRSTPHNSGNKMKRKRRTVESDLSASSPCERYVFMQVDVVSAKCTLCVGPIRDVCVWNSRVHPPIHHILAATNTYKQIAKGSFTIIDIYESVHSVR